jgi:hypothetical protein
VLLKGHAVDGHRVGLLFWHVIPGGNWCLKLLLRIAIDQLLGVILILVGGKLLVVIYLLVWILELQLLILLSWLRLLWLLNEILKHVLLLLLLVVHLLQLMLLLDLGLDICFTSCHLSWDVQRWLLLNLSIGLRLVFDHLGHLELLI